MQPSNWQTMENCGLDNTDDRNRVGLLQFAKHVQRALDRLARTVAPFGVFFTFTV